ncbi:MAG: T9SS type A sorting domain-containing protein [Bacteroidales bacterium]|nr:T9SS type A sorting domain-containing protein [Bacteroidales bacterium]
MKKVILTLTIITLFSNLFGQINPINNLTFWHDHDMSSTCPNYNCFELNWEAPDTLTQDTLIGYNIYRNSILWRFQDYIGVMCIDGTPPPCLDEDFLNFPAPFWIKVTAVYNSSHIESIANDSVMCGGILININTIENENFVIKKNPVIRGNDIIIKFSNTLEKNFNIRVYNNEGRIMEVIKITKDKSSVRISTDRFNIGIYNIVIILENEIFSRRVLII